MRIAFEIIVMMLAVASIWLTACLFIYLFATPEVRESQWERLAARPLLITLALSAVAVTLMVVMGLSGGYE